jgi:hypothetical protein
MTLASVGIVLTRAQHTRSPEAASPATVQSAAEAMSAPSVALAVVSGDRLDVVVLVNIDRWNAVNTLAAQVASVFVPGPSVTGLAEQPDPDPAKSARLLRLLDDVAQRRDTATLAPSLRAPRGPPRANPAFGFSGRPDRFVFLDREDHGATGSEHLGSIIRNIYRYKFVAGGRVVYDTFDVMPEGTIARFFPEEA